MAEDMPLLVHRRVKDRDAYRLRDLRDSMTSEQAKKTAKLCLIKAVLEDLPQEVACETAAMDSRIRNHMEMRGIEGDWEARKDFRLPRTQIIGDFNPVYLALTRESDGVGVGGICLYSITELNLPGNFDRISCRLWPGLSADEFPTQLDRVEMVLDVMQNFLYTASAWETRILITEFVHWRFSDGVRNDVGDQAIATWDSRLPLRSAHPSRPLTFVNLPDAQIAGRELQIVTRV